MNFNKVEPAIYQFSSINHLYKGLAEPDLQLEIYEYGTDALEVKLINRNYLTQRRKLKKHFIYLIICFYAYLLGMLLKHIHIIYIDIFLMLWLLPLLWRLLHLIEYEKFIYCYDFGLHLQIKKFLTTNNSFIAAYKIHDIVINEVLEDLDFRYLLIIRSKGKLFYKKPIIPVFKVFKPSCECLSLIYNHLNKIMQKPSIKT